MSAPVQDVFSRLYGGKREETKAQPINSAPVESTTISVFDRLYKAPSSVKFRRPEIKANLKPNQLQPLFSKVEDSQSLKKDKKGAKQSKLDPRKVKSDGNITKIASKQPEKQIEIKNSLKELEKESKKQKKKVEEKLKNELDQQKNRFEGEKYKKVLENPKEIEDVLNLNHPGSELTKQKKDCTGKKKGQHTSNSDRAESEEKLGEKPFIVLSITEQANQKSKKEKGSNSNANSTDGVQLLGGYQPHKITKEKLKLRDEILDENRRSSLSFMKGDDQLPVPVNLENDRNSPVWHDDYYVKDEEKPKVNKLSQPAWYNPPTKERHRAGHDSGRTRTNPLNAGGPSVFNVKDQVSASSTSRIEQVDYDKDLSGVYRAKVRRDSSQIVRENENIQVDLPIDYLNAEEIEDEELPLLKKQAQRLESRHSW